MLDSQTITANPIDQLSADIDIMDACVAGASQVLNENGDTSIASGLSLQWLRLSEQIKERLK